jgi:hypothetical protein
VSRKPKIRVHYFWAKIRRPQLKKDNTRRHSSAMMFTTTHCQNWSRSENPENGVSKKTAFLCRFIGAQFCGLSVEFFIGMWDCRRIKQQSNFKTQCYNRRT